METFSLTLANGATLTGRYNEPPPPPPLSDDAAAAGMTQSRALIVALHGGSYSSEYFDVDENHTASIASNALSIPFVAINRPCYEDSTPLDIPEGSSFPETYGDWLHRFILPALWRRFGPSNACTSIVLLCHSLGTPGAIIAAAAHACQAPAERAYPLSGLIISGWGSQTAESSARPEGSWASAKFRDEIFLPAGTANPAVYAHTERLMRPLPHSEATSIWSIWGPRWRAEWGAHIAVPVMLAVSGRDLLWKGTDEHLRDWMSAFTGSPRVDGSFLPGAPHNLEMSLWSRGWYARCFGFAYECAVTAAVRE